MKLLKKYHFPKAVDEVVSPIGSALKRGDIADAEKRIAALALDICNAVETAQMSPKQGDDYFMLLDMLITDNFPEVQLRQEIQNIIFEGSILHDYGKDFGANLQNMREWAITVLGGKSLGGETAQI